MLVDIETTPAITAKGLSTTIAKAGGLGTNSSDRRQEGKKEISDSQRGS
jgi:hypothetical protein